MISMSINMLDDSAHSAQRSIESELSIIAQEVIVEIEKEHFNRILLNDEIEINVINYRYAFACNMKFISSNLLISTYAKDKLEHCYDAYSACI
jgi:hypothetical protein